MEPGAEPPAPARGVRSFRRSSRDRYLGGVAGGIAERLDTEAAYVRLGLVGAAFYLAFADDLGAHGIVLVPYALLWALVPAEGQRSLVARFREREARLELALVVAVLAAGLLVLNRPSSILVLGLGGLAVALLRDRPPPRDVEGGDELGSKGTASPWSPRALFPRRPELERTRRPRREPALWPLTVGLLVVVAVIAVALDQIIDRGVDPRVVIDVALLAVGAVLVLSAWRGRARITLLAVGVLLPLWIATSIPDVGRFAGEGTLTVRPTSTPAATGSTPGSALSYEIGYGTLEVDLRSLPVTAGSETSIDIGVTAGRANVTVPADARVDVRGSIGVGAIEVDAPAHFLSDTDLAINRTVDRSYPALGTDCVDGLVRSEELAALAQEAGVITTTPTGEPPTPEEIVAAIGAAGYRRPTVEHVEQVEPFEDVDGPDPTGPGEPIIEFDEQGEPAVTTSPEQAGPSSVVYWRVPLGRQNWELCRPTPPPARPAVIIIRPTIGLGTLEIHRV